MRDLTNRQFYEACEKLGFKPAISDFGYVVLSDGVTRANRTKGGSTRRAQLAYLMRMDELTKRRAACHDQEPCVS